MQQAKYYIILIEIPIQLNENCVVMIAGSSPQISLDSTTSSRSNTPKLDSDTSI